MFTMNPALAIQKAMPKETRSTASMKERNDESISPMPTKEEIKIAFLSARSALTTDAMPARRARSKAKVHIVL